MRVGTSLLASAYQTDAGRVRTNNEDLFVCEPESGIFAVIDGVGGHSAGEVAAAIARRVILDRLARPLGSPAERVREAIALANNEIFRASEDSPEYRGMTCVLTLALVIDRHVTIGHVGDSRLYKLSPAGIRKMTHDHSPVGEREDAGELSESEAMHHPRRNEVFRDVGSASRDKDEDGFVEIVEDTIDEDSALLLCTDGLTDLVPIATISRAVREHAGDPNAVADRLVSVANEAGGADNVTIVYAEGSQFARSVNRAWTVLPRSAVPPPPAALQPERSDASPRKDVVSANDALSERLGLAWWWVVGRRATWLAVGLISGVALALLLAWRLGDGASPAPRTFAVGTTADYPFTRIAAAIASARAGDIVELEPGEYREQLTLPPGVDLVARVPGRSVLLRDPEATGDWIAVSANGPGRIRGLRIVSTADAPIAVGIQISGTDRHIELVDIDVPAGTAMSIAGASGVTVHGCVFQTTQGPAVVIDGSGEVTLANSTFVRTGHAPGPALRLKDSVWPVLYRNVFAGYRPEIIAGTSPADSARLLSGNVVASDATMSR